MFYTMYRWAELGFGLRAVDVQVHKVYVLLLLF